jgi:hypothetical protein
MAGVVPAPGGIVDHEMPVGALISTSGVMYGESGPVGVVTLALPSSMWYSSLRNGDQERRTSVPKRCKIPRELKPAYEAAVAQNWEITYTGGGHMKWLSPKGVPVFTGSTPGDKRAIKNHIARLKSNGLKLEETS